MFPILQFRLIVTDAGNPVQSNSIPVNIQVIRDLVDPVFSQNGYYTVPFSYLDNVNDVLVTVSATDADTDVSVLSIADVVSKPRK